MSRASAVRAAIVVALVVAVCGLEEEVTNEAPDAWAVPPLIDATATTDSDERSAASGRATRSTPQLLAQEAPSQLSMAYQRQPFVREVGSSMRSTAANAMPQRRAPHATAAPAASCRDTAPSSSSGASAACRVRRARRPRARATEPRREGRRRRASVLLAGPTVRRLTPGACVRGACGSSTPRRAARRARDEILDLNDNLRSMGLGAQFDFPAIVVIGDQSAGKSSVLEAISGVQVHPIHSVMWRDVT